MVRRPFSLINDHLIAICYGQCIWSRKQTAFVLSAESSIGYFMLFPHFLRCPFVAYSSSLPIYTFAPLSMSTFVHWPLFVIALFAYNQSFLRISFNWFMISITCHAFAYIFGAVGSFYGLFPAHMYIHWMAESKGSGRVCVCACARWFSNVTGVSIMRMDALRACWNTGQSILSADSNIKYYRIQ